MLACRRGTPERGNGTRRVRRGAFLSRRISQPPAAYRRISRRAEDAAGLDRRVNFGVDAAAAGADEEVGGFGGSGAGLDGDDGAAGLELALVVARLVFGDAQAGHGDEDAADGGA